MIVGTMFYALGDSVSKFLAIRYPVWGNYLHSLRHTLVFVFNLSLCHTTLKVESWHTTRPKLQLTRSALLIV